MKDEHKTVSLDAREESAVIEGLNRIRTEKLGKDECAEFVSGLMLKIIRSPSRKVKVRRDEAR